MDDVIDVDNMKELNNYVKLIEGSLFLNDNNLLTYLNEFHDIDENLKKKLLEALE
jgi:hypothetical protein